MKLKTFISNSIIAVSILGLFYPMLPNVSSPLSIKEAKAEVACPAPIPSTSMTIRSGGPSGPVLGQYTNEGAGYDSDGNPIGVGRTFATLTVPSGTVLYYQAETFGVEPVNRSPGSTHSFYGAGTTVIAPSTKAGYYSSGYYFSKQSSLTGQTNPLTNGVSIQVSGHNSCWGGFEDGESSIGVSVSVGGGGGPTPPTTTTRTATSSLAIVKNPTVSLLVNGSSTVTVPVGGTANFAWTTDSVNLGNSCLAQNDNEGKGGVDPSWNGPKVGQTPYTPPNPVPPSGGSQVVGPFDGQGSYTYSITCTGLNGVQSAGSSVQVIVGNPPTYSCSATPGTQTVVRGSNGSATITTEGFNGYNSAVTFTSSITPSSGTPPTITFVKNGQVPPASTTAVITTTGSTTVGSYSITFTGTDSVTCPPITFEVINPIPLGDIDCDGVDGSCEIAYGASASIAWDSLNVTNCDVYKTVGVGTPQLWQSGLSGAEDSGPITSTTHFDLDCTGPYGNVTDRVTVSAASTSTLNPPQGPRTSNAVCNQIQFSWQSPEGSSPNSYNVYRRTSPGAFGPADLIGNTNALTYNQIPPAVAPNILYFYGVSAVYNGGESAIVPAQNGGISLIECSANLDGSDKDLVRVNNRTSTFKGDSVCNNTSDVPTNYDIAAAGDSLTFRICVRNSGNVDLTNVTLTELPNANEFTRNLTNIQFDTANSTCSGSPSGMSWVIGNMPATDPDTSCFIYVTATVASPTGPDGELYRFQNIANITANSEAGPITKQVRSALLLFAKGSGIPDRTETAP